GREVRISLAVSWIPTRSPLKGVTVHVVPARSPCQRRWVSPMIGPHEYLFSTVTRSVGTHTCRSAGVYPCARSTCRGVGGHRATPPGAPAHGLSELLAAAVK